MLQRGRRQWPEPRREFTDEVLRRLGVRRYSRRTRVVFAAGFAAVGLTAFAGLGGVGSAMSGMSGSLGGIKGSGGQSASRNGHLAAANAQYRYPAWVCLQRARRMDTRYKLRYSRNGRFGDGWTLLVYYGQQPGPCPPEASGGSAAVGASDPAPAEVSGDLHGAANDQYLYPAWVCLRKRQHGGYKYKLMFSRDGQFRGGWELSVYYGRRPGPCPPR